MNYVEEKKKRIQIKKRFNNIEKKKDLERKKKSKFDTKKQKRIVEAK
jgi:hypothetical protein